MTQHHSVWVATADQPTFPPLTGTVDVDVVVVGAGITGLTTALFLADDGARVAVVEASSIGAGTTGHTTGKVTSQHTLLYATLVERHGEERARAYAEANQAAIETVVSLAGRVAANGSAGIPVGRADALAYTQQPDLRSAIEHEVEVAQRLGLPATLVEEVDLPYPVVAAVRFADQAYIHAGRYLAGLARMFTAAGGVVYEGARVVDIDDGGDGVEVRTADGGVVRARWSVVATLLPVVDRGGFFAKAAPSRAYGLAVRLARPAPQHMYISVEEPTRSLRPWPEAGPEGMIVVGGGHPTGHEGDTEHFYAELEAWVRSTFDVVSVDYRWSAQDYKTVDDLPYVGRSPRTRRVLVATGFRKWGLSNGTAAARMLADFVADRPNPWAFAFDATRVGGVGTLKDVAGLNVHVGERLVKDRIGRLTAPSVDELAPGEGAIAKVNGETVAAYRDEAGVLHMRSPSCTHLGCTVQWNSAERSWDCPCHGSRFAVDGSVLNTPAVDPLPPAP